MKKRFLAAVIGIVYLVLCFPITTIAFIDEPREYVHEGGSIAEENQHITPKTKAVFQMATHATAPLYVYSYNSDDDTTYANQGIIMKYNLSEISEDAARITANMAISNRSSGSLSAFLVNTPLKMGVYALENLKSDWKMNDKWEDMIEYDIDTADFRKNHIATIDTSNDMYEVKTSESSVTVNGYEIVADVTDYVVAQKKAGKTVVNLLFIPIAHGNDPSNHKMQTYNFECVDYQYGTYANCYRFRSTMNWYSIKKSEINTVEDITLKNGYLNEKFINDAVDSGDELKKTYTVGVKDETKAVELSYELSSMYSTVDGAVTEGMVGDTLVLPVKSEAGVTRTYYFNLVSMADAGYTEDGKISVDSFDFDGTTINAIVKNNSTKDKTAVVVVYETENNKISKITQFDYDITSGYTDIEEDFSSSKDIVSMYIADKENIFVPISDIITQGELTDYTNKEDVISIYYKDITKEELTVSGKWETPNTAITAFVLNDGKKITDYNGSNTTEVFTYAGAFITDENGYYGFDVTMPKSDDYTICIIDSTGKTEELPIYYASTAEKDSALEVIYGAADENELKAELNLSLTEEERTQLDDKYNETSGLEGHKDYIKILALDYADFHNGVSENGFLKILFNLIKEDTNTDNFNKHYNDALIYERINSGVVEDILVYNEKLQISEDLCEIYNNFSAEGKKNLSFVKIAGNELASYSDIKDIAEELIVLTFFEEAGNPNNMIATIEEYSDILNVEDYIDKFKKLSGSKKEKVINKIINATPIESVSDFEDLFEDEVKAQSKKQSEGSSGGNSGGSFSGGSGTNQVIDITGSVNTGSNAPVDNLYTNIYKFADLTDYNWAENAVKYLFDKGIVNGVSETEYNPSGEVKREEFVKMISVLLDNSSVATSFTDVDVNMWYASYINKAVASGVIKGISDTEFGIGKGITREDMAVIIYRALKGEKVENAEMFADDNNISEYAKDAVYFLKSKKIVSGTGNGNYEPKRIINRAEAAVVLYNILNIAK